MHQNSKRSSKWSLLALPLSLFIVACTSKIEVSVANDAQQSLKDVYVIAQGQALSLGSIAPGQKKKTEFRPQEDSSIKVSFIKPESKEEFSQDLAYIEASFHGQVEVRVDKDFKVHTTNGLKIGF